MQNFEKLLLKSYNFLKVQDDLSPNNHIVNTNLSQLIGLANDIFHPKKINNLDNIPHSTLVKFRAICASAECEMEKYWANYFINKPFLDKTDLRVFWYYNNYEEIASKEYNLIKNNTRINDKTQILFAGSGALPLTAIIMHIKYGLNISLLDVDKDAIEKSSLLIRKLDLPIKVIHQDFFKYDLSRYDIVFAASLISNKKKVVEKFKSDNVPFYLLRGADSLYQAFYEDIPNELKTGTTYSYLPSDNATINSSYLFHNTLHNMQDGLH